MADWIDVAGVDEIQPGQWKTLYIDDDLVAVINVAGDFFAIEDVCTHDGGTLTGGEIDGDQIICPRHGAAFCIKTGEVTCPPAYEDIHAFPVKVEQGRIWVQDDR